MTTVIRPATADDVAALADLAALTFPLACPPGSTRADQDAFVATHLSAAHFTQYLADGDRVVLVAVEAGSGPASTPAGRAPGAPEAHELLVGYTMLVGGEPADSDVRAAISWRPPVELSKCYVLPGHHGRGVAATLMAATLEAAARTGAAGVWLGVNQQNARAQAFYARHGFTRVGTKHFQVGDRLEDDYVLERAL